MNPERADLPHQSLEVAAFQAANGDPAVEFTIPGITELRMTPAVAILVSVKLFLAAFYAQAGHERDIEVAPADVDQFILNMSKAITTGLPPGPETP